MLLNSYDVIVVGSGNAGCSAAVSAIENGAKNVLLVEKSPKAWAGGNTSFTAGAYRTVYHGLKDVLSIVPDVPRDVSQQIDMDAYLEEDFMNDIKRVTDGRSDPELSSTLVKESNSTIKWLAKNGIKFQLSFNRQSYYLNGRYKFWGGMVLSVKDGGKGLTEQHLSAVRRKGVKIQFNTSLDRLLVDHTGSVIGVTIKDTNGTHDVLASGGVVLCAGGFEANPKMRAQYLGPGWDLAHVRGTPFNTGDCLTIAVRDVNAKQVGNWSGCHSVAWDANSSATKGDLILTNQYTKSGYPLGLMLNANGDRFVDEGIDMRNFTYAKFGREILKQPNGIAFQVWDSYGATWLRKEEYADDVVEKITANTIEELALKLESKGLSNCQNFVQTVQNYNEAVKSSRAENPNAEFDPSKKDGVSTRSSSGGLALDKTNWAIPLTKGPFVAVKVTCGVTFTFGGLKIDHKNASVITETTGQAVPGLYCAGEMVGGLFYGNYPGGSGLTAGAVFGRLGGKSAAIRARQNRHIRSSL